MNRRIIKAVIEKKLQDWISSIEDSRVQILVKEHTILTGGAIASMLLGEDVKDFDIYFRNKETTMAVAKYYVTQFMNTNREKNIEVLDTKNGLMLPDNQVKIYISSKGVASEDGSKGILQAPFEDVMEELPEDADNKYRPVFLSSNAITLSNKIQIVVRFSGEPNEIHKNYDFVHCTNYYDLGKGTLTLIPEALECLLNKELRYQGSKYPICSMIRTRKFLKRGFNINAGQYLKMAMQISKLDLTKIDVLEDQLVGVDSSYFNILIEAVRSKTESDPSFRLDSSYLAELIDRIF